MIPAHLRQVQPIGTCERDECDSTDFTQSTTPKDHWAEVNGET
jgi:hypothetical protein